MKTFYNTILAAVALTGVFIFGGSEAQAQNSISIQSTLNRTYYVEVQYHFYHWTSGGEQIYWSTVLETESYDEAQMVYKIYKANMENGNLDSSGTTSITTATDVRIRTVYNPIYMNHFSRFSYRFR